MVQTTIWGPAAAVTPDARGIPKFAACCLALWRDELLADPGVYLELPDGSQLRRATAVEWLERATRTGAR